MTSISSGSVVPLLGSPQAPSDATCESAAIV